jgi:hypothetical protein
MEISYERNGEGAWLLTTIYQNRFYKKVYYFYTKQEAAQLFKSYVKGEN